VSLDTDSYASALRAALRQSPDVILLGEMRDEETVSTALTAAEMGHLVISTMFTVGAANAIDRLVDLFPAARRERVSAQLSAVLQAVVSQQLVPTVDGAVAPVFQFMTCNNEMRSIIRDGYSGRITKTIDSYTSDGMISMDAGLLKLFREGRITARNALSRSLDPDSMAKYVNSSDRMYF
jgi:twitching motility protein PilT